MAKHLEYTFSETGKANADMIQCNESYCRFDYPCSQSYDCTSIKILVRPGKYKIKLCGAKGGNLLGYQRWTGLGGKGGCSQGTLTIQRKQIFFLFIGGKGIDLLNAGIKQVGGYNGGGWSQNGACSGGGGTDLRLINSQDSHGLRSRIIVAGGGGGANDDDDGGDGGGFEGKSGDSKTDMYAFGANQTHAGQYPIPGGFGCGASPNETPSLREGGAGGGGYFGGARAGNQYASGGGGSGYVSCLDGCQSVLDQVPIRSTKSSVHFSEFVFDDASMATGENNGNGSAEITYIGGIHTSLKRRKKTSLVLMMAIFCV